MSRPNKPTQERRIENDLAVLNRMRTALQLSKANPDDVAKAVAHIDGLQFYIIRISGFQGAESSLLPSVAPDVEQE